MRAKGLVLRGCAAAVALALLAPTAGAQDGTNESQRPPELRGFVATFTQAIFATDYAIDAVDPDGDTLTYAWDLLFTPAQEDCGRFTADGPSARWEHPHESQLGAVRDLPEDRYCTDTAQQAGGHPGTVRVVVSDGTFDCAVEYPDGSRDGALELLGQVDCTEREPATPTTPSLSTTPPSAVPSSTTAAPPTDDEEGGGIEPLVLILGVALIVVAIGGFAMVNRRATPVACDCGCGVSIDGPRELGLCACDPVTFVLRPTDTNLAVVEARSPTGAVLFARRYHATIKATCHGDEVIEESTVTWALTPRDDGFALGVTARMTVTCPTDGSTQKLTCTEEEFRVTTHSAPCLIRVVTLSTLVRVGHVAIHISCGEAETMYGFYPDEHRFREPSKGTTYNTMIGCPGKVEVRDASGTTDAIGEDYAQYYSDHDKKVWIIEADCSVCRKVRAWWEALRANPGTYQLLGSNCATQAIESLAASGIDIDITVPRNDGEPGRHTVVPYRPDNIDEIMDANQGERPTRDGGTVTVHPRTNVPRKR